jgi:plasmid stabilization system protein ParE
MTFKLLVLHGAETDLLRIRDHLLDHDAEWIEERLHALRSALGVLATNPFIGRPSAEYRELIIGSGSWGYVAIYRIDEARRLVRVLAVRGQREGGYRR